MKEWLVDGGHKMYRIPVDDPKVKERLNNWLKRNALPKIEDVEALKDDKYLLDIH